MSGAFTLYYQDKNEMIIIEMTVPTLSPDPVARTNSLLGLNATQFTSAV